MNRAIDQADIDRIASLWDLEPAGRPFSTHSSVLLPATRDGIPVMLKLTSEPDEMRGGDLLAWWDGAGAVRVIASSPGALLMERPTGSRSLYDMALAGHDDAAVAVLCTVIAQLHAPKMRPLPPLAPLEELFTPLLESNARDVHIQAGKAMVLSLLSAQEGLTPLHGDIHHRNVLEANDGRWLAIDPKGLYGDRVFDYVNLFRNPTADIAIDPVRFERRIESISSMAELATQRLARWIAAFCALSLVWDYYPEGSPQADRALAQLALDFITRSTG